MDLWGIEEVHPELDLRLEGHRDGWTVVACVLEHIIDNLFVEVMHVLKFFLVWRGVSTQTVVTSVAYHNPALAASATVKMPVSPMRM